MSGTKPDAALAPFAAPRLRLPKAAAGGLTSEERASVRDLVVQLLSRPTAPYAEDQELLALREFARTRPRLRLATDRYENLALVWPGDGTARDEPVLAFSAHLDHPGLVCTEAGPRPTALLRGGVPPATLETARARFFEPASGASRAIARVTRAWRDAQAVRCELALEAGTLEEGLPATWELPSAALRSGRLLARVCDDLLGAAAILAVLDALAAERHPRAVVGIFTRAEEVGFVGCQGLLREGLGALGLSERLAVIGLECSPRRLSARLGLGPVIRVGDKGSVFDPMLTHHLQDCAQALAERLGSFQHQRALMDGGNCESTAYNLWGVPAGGLCLALANYHNVGPGGRLAPEAVAWSDLEGLVALMREAARAWPPSPISARIRARLDGVWAREREHLERSARRPQAEPARGGGAR